MDPETTPEIVYAEMLEQEMLGRPSNTGRMSGRLSAMSPFKRHHQKKYEKKAKRMVKVKAKLKKHWNRDNLEEKMIAPVDNPSVLVTFETRVDRILAGTAHVELNSRRPTVINASSAEDTRYFDLARYIHFCYVQF